MTRESNVRGGFGLVEVVIALAVLAVGVLALAQLQVRALAFTSNAESMRTLTRVAEAEMKWQQLNSLAGRASELSCVGTGCNTCESEIPAGMTCRYDVVPCGVVVGSGGVATFTCGMNVTSPQAYEIRLDIADRRGNAASFSTIATGRYVAGIISDVNGGGSGGNGNGEGGSPPGGGDEEATTPPGDGTNPGTSQPGNRPPNVGGGNPNAPGRNR